MSYEKMSYKKFNGKGKANPSPYTLHHEQKVALNRKRGKLAPLMSEEAKQAASIHELSYDFGCRITRLFQYLTEDAECKEYVQSKQIYWPRHSVRNHFLRHEELQIMTSIGRVSTTQSGIKELDII